MTFQKIVTVCFYLFLFLYLIPVAALAPLTTIAGVVAGICALILGIMAML